MACFSTMISDRIAIPFSFSNLYAGFGTVEGILYYEKEGLRFEFELSFLRLFDTGVRDVIISIDDLVAVEWKHGWLSHTLALQGKSLRTFKSIPGNKQGRLLLNVAKKDRAQAEHLATILETRLTTRQVSRMRKDLESF